jgi:hypothetical protein
MGWSYIIEQYKDIVDVDNNKLSTVVTSSMFCGQGHKLNKITNSCDLCPDNEFQDDTNHRKISCKPHLKKEQIICDEGKYLDEAKFYNFIKKNKNSSVAKNDVCTPHNISATDCDSGKYFDVNKYNQLGNDKQIISTMKSTVCLSQDTLTANQCSDGTYFHQAGLDTLPKNKKATINELKTAACKPHTEYKNDLKNTVKANGRFFSEDKWNSKLVSKSKIEAADVSNNLTQCDFLHKVNESTNACVECPAKHVQSESDPAVCSPYSSKNGYINPERNNKTSHGLFQNNWGFLNTKATNLNDCIKYLKDNNINNVSNVGRRTSDHNLTEWKNSCWFYTKSSDNATNYVPSDRRADNVHEMICIDDNLRPKPCVENSCANATDYIQTIDGNKYCTPQNTCPNGEELKGADINSPGTCLACTAGKYKSSGQNREGCTAKSNTCSGSTYFTGTYGNLTTTNDPKCTSKSNTCGGITYFTGTYGKSLTTNDPTCLEQNTCPNGQTLVGATNSNPGTCQACPGDSFKNSGQNRSGCTAKFNTCGESTYTPNPTYFTGTYRVPKTENNPICTAKYNTCGGITYFTGYGISATTNDPSCLEQNTCPNGQQLVGANNSNPGNCQWCQSGSYKISGQDRKACIPISRQFLEGTEHLWEGQIGGLNVSRERCAEACLLNPNCKAFQAKNDGQNGCIMFNNKEHWRTRKNNKWSWRWYDNPYRGYRFHEHIRA